MSESETFDQDRTARTIGAEMAAGRAIQFAANKVAAAAETPTQPSDPPKPGWKTSEARLALLAVILTAVLGSDVIPAGTVWLKLAMIGGIVLTSMGYTVGRSMVKAAYHGAAKLLLVGFAVAQLQACACVDQNNTACIVQHAVVDCTEGSIVSQAPGFIPFITQVINIVIGNGGSVDWSSFEAAVAGLSLKDAACITAELEAYLSTGPPRLSAVRAGYHAGWSGWVSKHFPAGTRFKLPGGASL